MKNHYILAAILLLALTASSCVPPPEGEDEGTVVVQNYVPPPWAPPYDNLSSTRYYYLPDYGIYYDVWTQQFWYPGDGGVWVSGPGVPPMYAGVDLNAAFVVLVDHDVSRPWLHSDYYRDNYPAHGYDHYTDIVVNNRIVTNVEPGHKLVPRAFNENTNRVTFMQRPEHPEPPVPIEPPPGHVAPPRPPAPPQVYHHVVHEVPMHSIAPSMPAESKKFNYGSGYSKSRAPQNTEEKSTRR